MDRSQLTFFAEPVPDAQPAPDGRGFLFSKDSDGNEFYQLYFFDLASGDYRLLSDGKSRNTDALYAREGSRYAFATTRRNGRDTDIHLADSGKPASTPLVEAEGSWSPVAWSPDGRQLLVGRYMSILESELYLVDIASGERRRFQPASTPISFSNARFAGDGRGIYYLSDESSDFQRLRYERLDGGGAKVLSADIPWDVDGLALSDDGRWLAFTANVDGASELHLLDLKSGRPAAAPKIPVGLIGDLAFDRQTRHLGFVLNSPRSASDVFAFVPGARKPVLTRWTSSETGGLKAETFTEPTLIHYPSFDGRSIPAFLYAPSGPGPHPVLISIHGGPEAQSQPSYSAITEFFIRELGLAVLTPNVRGSAGYGKAHLALDNHRLREDSVRDIGSLLDWIATQATLDAKRVVVSGGSYGGYMSLAAMTHYNDRLAGGIDVVGISSFVSFLSNTQDYRRDLRRVDKPPAAGSD